MEIHAIHASSKAEKTVLMELVAQRVDKIGADLLIDVGEIWLSTTERFRPEHLINSNDALGREEAIAVTAVTSKGEIHSIVVPFKRGIFGGIKFSDELDFTDKGAIHLEPVFKVWNKGPAET